MDGEDPHRSAPLGRRDRPDHRLERGHRASGTASVCRHRPGAAHRHPRSGPAQSLLCAVLAPPTHPAFPPGPAAGEPVKRLPRGAALARSPVLSGVCSGCGVLRSVCGVVVSGFVLWPGRFRGGVVSLRDGCRVPPACALSALADCAVGAEFRVPLAASSSRIGAPPPGGRRDGETPHPGLALVFWASMHSRWRLRCEQLLGAWFCGRPFRSPHEFRRDATRLVEILEAGPLGRFCPRPGLVVQRAKPFGAAVRQVGAAALVAARRRAGAGRVRVSARRRTWACRRHGRVVSGGGVGGQGGASR